MYGTSGFPEKDANVAICADPVGVDRSELIRECEEECGQLYRGFFVGIGGECDPQFGNCEVNSDNSTAAFTLADCSITDVQQLGSHCLDTEGWLLPSNVGQFGAALSVGDSSFSVDVDLPSPVPGDVSGNANVAGRVSFSIAPDPRIGTCPPTGCKIFISQLDLTTSPGTFDVDNALVGIELSNVRVTNYAIWEGTWQPNGAFTIPASHVKIQTNFEVDGVPGSLTTTANDNIHGTANPTTGAFSISSLTIQRDDVTLTGEIHANVDQFPPTARVEPRDATVECNGINSATIEYTGASSTDQDGDIIGYTWELQSPPSPAVNLGPGVNKQVTMPFGQSRVILNVYDSRAAFGVDFIDVAVVDHTPPVLVPAAVETVVGCSAGGVVSLPIPSVSDVCTETGNIHVQGQVIASSVPGLAVPIPLTDGAAAVPPGSYTVRWTATDGSNNSAFIDQNFTIDSCWPMFGRLRDHSGRSPFAGPATDERLFTFETGADVTTSPAVGTDGTIYFGSDDNRVYAVNLDGTLKWFRTTGGDVDSSPAIGVGGIIYVGSDDDKLYALNPSDGSVVCSRSLGGLDVESSPTIGPDGTVFVGSEDNRMYALHPQTCAINWSVQTGGDVNSSAAVGSNGHLYFGSDDNRIYARLPNGTAKWTFTTGDDVKSSPSLSEDESLVFVGSDDRRIRALRADTGQLVWSRTVGGAVRTRPALGSSGTVYVGSEDGKLYALNPADGSVLWSRSLGPDVSSSAAIGGDGTVYVGADDDRVYALNGATGETIWSYHTGLDVKSSPAIGLNGVLYVGSDSDRLYAFGTAQTMGLRAELEPATAPAGDQPAASNRGCGFARSSSSSGAPLLGLAFLVLAGVTRRRREPGFRVE